MVRVGLSSLYRVVQVTRRVRYVDLMLQDLCSASPFTVLVCGLVECAWWVRVVIIVI